METPLQPSDPSDIPYSDPTYEAWKPPLPANPNARVLIPILPMRHGNYLVFIWDGIALIIPILPMRHGNEEAQRLLDQARENSDPTYEAWKLISSYDQIFFIAGFRSYL